jgi:hypothetical protein
MQTLERVKFRFHRFGTVKIDGKRRDFYLGDSLSDSQLAEIQKDFPNASRMQSRTQYAPEIKSAALVV